MSPPHLPTPNPGPGRSRKEPLGKAGVCARMYVCGWVGHACVCGGRQVGLCVLGLFSSEWWLRRDLLLLHCFPLETGSKFSLSSFFSCCHHLPNVDNWGSTGRMNTSGFISLIYWFSNYLLSNGILLSNKEFMPNLNM